jgi:uncharacterized DUF497 family protein
MKASASFDFHHIFKAWESLSIEYLMPDVFYTHPCPNGKTNHFAWDQDKDEINGETHDINFVDAVEAFCDPKRVIQYDKKHSTPREKRFYWLGKIKEDHEKIHFGTKIHS